MMRRHVWMELEMCGQCWTAEENILIFIYTLVITISLASEPSTTNKPIFLAIVVLLPTLAPSVPYLLLFCLANAFKRLGFSPWVRGIERNTQANQLKVATPKCYPSFVL